MKQNKKRQHPRRRGGILLRACGLAAFIALTAGLVAGVSAKYVHRTETPGQAAAANFYFVSDLLDGQTHTVTATEADGTASIIFCLQNHADALRYSEVDIAYTVTVDDANVGVSQASGTLEKGEDHDVSITLSGLQPGKTYKVTAKATAPYAKELTGTIVVAAMDNTVHYQTKDRDAYLEVTVWTVDYSGQVELTYPAGLIPDNTNPVMRDWKSGDTSREFSMTENSAYVFRFFKGAGYTEGGEVTAHAKA